MRKALKVSQFGTIEIVDLDAAESSYTVLSEAVGGPIEPVYFAENLTLWVNEEGKLADEWYVNPFAQRLFAAKFGNVDLMHGNVIFTGGADDEGEDVGLTDEQIAQLLQNA